MKLYRKVVDEPYLDDFYEEIDPADLELGYAKAWGELGTKITEEWRIARGSVDRYGQGYRVGLGYALAHLKKLKSARRRQVEKIEFNAINWWIGDGSFQIVCVDDVLTGNQIRALQEFKGDLHVTLSPAQDSDKPETETPKGK